MKTWYLPLTLTLAGSMLSCSAIAEPAMARITVDLARPGAQVSPTLWGIFFEDINLSADGGIYPELVRNRSFEDTAEPDNWTLVNQGDGRSTMAIDTGRPLNPFNRRSLRIELDGGFSLQNNGYWGMNVVQSEMYQLLLAACARDGFTGPLEVKLEEKSGRAIAEGQIRGLTRDWKWFALDLPASGSDPKARLSINASGNGTLWLDMVSVLPKKTWKNHGLRPDLCEMLAGLKPSFVRYPGGCWVEGDDIEHMYRWKRTIGDVANRIPLWNIWGYWATHGLGYHEYLQLSEDLGAASLFCINVGMSHREVVPLDQMGQWVQDALDSIEYANGPTNTVWGGLRAKHGHPEPFNLKYIEIGNENGGPPYHERWAMFHRAIKSRHPEIQLIADVWGGYPTSPMPDIVDEHYYNSPEFFMLQADRYDKYSRNGPKVFVGEYAVTQGCGLGNLRGAIGEAAFMTGLERNSDVVIMAAYAPLFVNVNHRKWNPDLINFDSARVYGLPSYYVQKMFSENRGDVVLPMQLSAPPVTSRPQGGSIGVGTWSTQAEFKDIEVTSGDRVLYSCDFAEGASGWKLLGGDWSVRDGALRQNSGSENIRAVVSDKSWTNYTYTLRARKLGGREGFLILFRVQDENEKSWWNIGGWGNERHAIELGGIVGDGVPGGVQTGRWYDIRIEVKDENIKCFLDNKLVHDVTAPTVRSLYASATRTKAGDVIVKVVNGSHEPQPAEITLEGTSNVAGQVKAVVLASDKPTDENSLDNPRKVAPKDTALQASGNKLRHSFPGNSLTVLRFSAVQ